MMTPLGAVSAISTAFPFRKKVESEPGGDVAVIQIRDIGSTAGGPTDSAPVVLNDDGRYDRYLLQPGDLLFQSRGTRFPTTVVPAGLRGIASSGVHVVRPERRQVLPEYLSWWINLPASQERLATDIARGSYVPFVAKKDLETFMVPVPPLEMQSRIVAAAALRRRELELQKRLDTMTQKLVDAVTVAAATRDY